MPETFLHQLSTCESMSPGTSVDWNETCRKCSRQEEYEGTICFHSVFGTFKVCAEMTSGQEVA
jgi:hypothetical protein